MTNGENMKRNPDESFEDYKKRRKQKQEETKSKLQGKVIWSPYGRDKAEASYGKAKANDIP